MVLMGPFQIEILDDLCMDFYRNTNDDSICVCAQCCVYSSCSTAFLAAGIPCLPHLAHTEGLCWLFTETATELDILSPVYRVLLSQSLYSWHEKAKLPFVTPPFSLPRLSLLSKPCSSPQIWQQLLEDQPAQSAAVPASFHCGFSLSLSRPLASVNAC